MNRKQDLTRNHIFSQFSEIPSLIFNQLKENSSYFSNWNKKPSIEHDSNVLCQGNADLRQFKKFYIQGKFCDRCGKKLNAFDSNCLCHKCEDEIHKMVEYENLRTSWNRF